MRFLPPPGILGARGAGLAWRCPTMSTMATDLADLIDGTPGRFVPQEMRGELIEAEHLVRYWWAARLASGARLLADGGAAEAVGIDIAAPVVEVASAESPDATFVTGDVSELPFPDGSF